MPACHAGGHEFESRTHRKSRPTTVSVDGRFCFAIFLSLPDERFAFLLLILYSIIGCNARFPPAGSGFVGAGSVLGFFYVRGIVLLCGAYSGVIWRI